LDQLSYHRVARLARRYQTVSVGLFAAAILIFAAFYAKSLYATLGTCSSPFLQRPCLATQGFIVTLYNQVPGIRELWNWVPNVANSPFAFVYSPAIVVAIFLFYFSGRLRRIARELKKDMSEALRHVRVTGMAASLLKPDQQAQTVGDIRAGGDVSVTQIIGEPKRSQQPLWNFIFGILGATIAAVVGQYINVMLGFSH
jgi:hypothetical protein